MLTYIAARIFGTAAPREHAELMEAYRQLRLASEENLMLRRKLHDAIGEHAWTDVTGATDKGRVVVCGFCGVVR